VEVFADSQCDGQKDLDRSCQMRKAPSLPHPLDRKQLILPDINWEFDGPIKGSRALEIG
jgi:hypothetical protein